MTTNDNNTNNAAQIAAACMARIKRPTVAQISQSMINGIGYEIGWTFSGSQQTPQQLRSRLLGAGLDPSTAPNIDPVAGIKRAVAEWRRKDGRKTIAHAEIVAEDTDTNEVAVGILYHTRKGDREVAKLQREILVWNTQINDWTKPGTSDESTALRRRAPGILRRKRHTGQADHACAARRPGCAKPPG